MGNSATSIAARVSSLTPESLEEELSGDLSILGDQKQFFNHIALIARRDLQNYKVLGSPSSSSINIKDIGHLDEEQMLCSMEDKEFIKDRHEKVIKSLLREIDMLRDDDSSSIEIEKKLQFLSRTYEALLRMDEREKRKSKIEVSSKKDEINPIVKSGLVFGLSSLFSIITVLGSDKPELYKFIIKAASNIVSGLNPMELNSEDPSTSQIVSSVLAFFNSMLKKELPSIQEEDINACYSILFGLYIATGNLCTALVLALTFSNLDQSQDYSLIYKQIFPMIANFKTIVGKNDSFALDTEKKGKGIEFRNEEPGLLMRTTSDGWGSVLSTQTWIEGAHYFEMTWVEGEHDYVYYGVCNETYSDLDSLPSDASFAISYRSTGEVYRSGQESYSWEKYSVGEKIGILLNMDDHSVLFFHNGNPDPKGPVKGLPESMKIFMCLGGISKHKIIFNPESMPKSAHELVDNYRIQAEENLADLNIIDRAIKTGEITDEYLQLRPIELSKYILRSFDKLNDNVIQKLENEEKKLNLKKRAGLTLDIKNETVEILEKFTLIFSDKIQSESIDRESKETYSELLVYVLKLIRAHLIGSDVIPNATLERQLRIRIMKNTIDLIKSMPGSKISEEATKIATSCFSVFYKDPQEKLSYLLDRLKDQMDGVEISGVFKELEDRIFIEMARPDKLFPALELINDDSQHLVETYFKYLIELSSEVSKKFVRGEETSVGILKLLETSQIALFGQAAKSNLKGKWQEILMNYSLSVFQNCEEVLSIVKQKENKPSLSDELTNTIKKTILADLLETLLYMLSLTRMSFNFLDKILPALQSITSSLQIFDPKPKILNKAWVLAATDSYESTHPYDNSLDINYTVKILGARKYYLVFDPQFRTEKNCDYLELWTNDKKEENLFRWDGEDFPKNGESVEVNAPYLYFTFHSDASVNYWGWKINIFGEVQTDYYAKMWPDTIKDAAKIMTGFISVKLISGEFEIIPEDEKVKTLLQNPLLKYGISDKTLSLVKHQNPIPENLITLSQVPGIGEKFKPKMLNQFIKSGATIKLVCNNKSELKLQEYIDSFGKWGDAKYSDNQFINDFIEGNNSIVDDWNALKLLSGVSEEDTIIGGPEFDKAERAIFAVYIELFEFSATFKKILHDHSNAGATIKYLIKDAVKYRKWADKYIKKLRETVSITIEEFSKDIVLKCALLINSEHNQELNEIEITKTIKHLEHKSEDENLSEDAEEIKKISGLILSIFETPVSAEKIVDTIEKRRVKAIARALGFSILGNLMSLTFRKETVLIRAFADSLKKNNIKTHYWDNLEGVDSNLLKCIQKLFYNIYGYLQKELLNSKNEAIERPLYSHYLTVLDALCFPLKDLDNIMILEQQFPLAIGLLLNWSKGYIEEAETKSFLYDQCITGLKIMQEVDISDDVEKILLGERKGEGKNMYLIIDHSGTLPVVDFQITSEEIKGYENLGQFSQNGEFKSIFIKKSEVSPENQFLVSIKDNFECEYKPYYDLLSNETEDDKKSRELLKDKLCRAAWVAYKVLVFSAVGNTSQNTSIVKQTVQDLFLSIIFNELKWDQSFLELGYSGFKLSGAVSGELWVNKMMAGKPYKKNPMQEWTRQFNKETEKLEDCILKEIINDLIAKADPAMKGVLTPAEISKLDSETSELLLSQGAFKNSKGNFDFFRYINVIYSIKDTFPKQDQTCIEHSKVWAQIPADFDQAALCYDSCNIETVHKNIVSKFNLRQQGKSFARFFDLFELSEAKGIVQSDKLPEDCPSDFKNVEGNLDLYVTMHAIAKNQNKYFSYYQELKHSLLQYADLPDSCLEIYKEKKSASEYITSLLWSIYGCLGSKTIINLLAREEYLTELLKVTFFSSAESNFALGSRILKAILPSQHSAQSLESVWSKLPQCNTERNNIDFIQFLFKSIGKMAYWYGFRDTKTKLFRCGYEAIVLLKELMSAESWRSKIILAVLKSLNEAITNLRDGKALPMYQAGAIETLAILSNQEDILGNDPIELAEAKLTDSETARAIVREIDGYNVSVYSPVSDEIASVNTNSIAYLRTINKFNAMNVLSQEELQSIKDSAISLWFALVDSEFMHFNMKPERTASFRILYAHLENVIVNALSFVLKKKEIDDSECADLLRCIMKHAKTKEKALNSKAKQLLFKQILKTIAENCIYNDLTDEEVMKIFSNANDRTKDLIDELNKENIPTMIIAKCLDKGIKDKNEILEFANKIVEPKSSFLFKLLPLESEHIKTVDIEGNAHIYQNKNHQFVIENNSFTATRKEITTVPDLSVFRSIPQFVESLTIITQLEGIHYQDQLAYGLRLGTVDIGISTSSGSPSFEVNGSVFSPAKLDEIMTLRITLNPIGELKIINENTKESFDLQDTTAFNGLKMGAYGLYMNAGTSASLLSFEVYEGKDYLSAPTKVSWLKETENYKTIKVIPKSENYDRLRLKLLGLTDDQINQALSSDRDLRSSLDYISKNFPNAFHNTISSLNQDVITDIKLFKTAREIPNGFSAVPVYEDGKQKELNIPNKMVLCAKKEQVTSGNGFASIKLGEEAKDYTEIGNIDPGDQSSNSIARIWVKKGEIDRDECIKDLIFVKSSSIYSVKVPLGYKIIKDNEGNAINLGLNLEKKSTLFLATRISDTAMSCTLTPFKKMNSSKLPLCGLIETTECIEENVDDNIFESQSIQELFCHYYNIMDTSKQASYKKLTLMLIKKSPTSISTIAEEFGIIKLFDFLGKSVNKITTKIDTVFSQDNSQFKEKLLKDCLERILKCLIHDEKQEVSLAPLTIESPTHPYDSSMDLDQEIRIPGAKKLNFVFDLQCETESNCDLLRFYKSANRIDEIKCISGQGESNWASFEVEGEVVYLHFHSDGSVNYLGYKFDVIPEGSVSAIAEQLWPAMWILNKISSLNPMPNELMELTTARYIQPIFLHSLSANTLDLKLDLVRMLNKIIRHQNESLFKNIFNILIAQANELHNVVSSNKVENSLMQATARLLEESSHRFQLTGEELWFMEFCELVSDIKGLSEADEFLETFLFESFKKHMSCNLGRTYESEHPYIKKTKKECIQIPGASFISIVFDSNSCLDPKDAVIFSYDEYGKKVVEEKRIESTYSDARWREEPCGSKIVFENGNSQATRVKASGWGNAIWSENYSDGAVSIKFKIESDGCSEYWYIGVYKTAKDVKDYWLNEYIGCDCPHDMWSWKKTGEVHKKGWFKEGFEGFKADDEITMLIDMNLRELTFYNGTLEVFKFTGIASSVTPVVCFGGLNQVISVISVERMAASRPLSERTFDIIGDSVYYWAPVHKVANIKHVWDSNQNGASLNPNKFTVTKSINEKTYHETEAEMRYGKYYVEISVESKGLVGVGFTKKSLINTNIFEDKKQTVIYYSNGKIGSDEYESFCQNDIVGSYIDFEKNEIAFYKQNKLIHTVQISLNLDDSEDCFKFIAVLSEENQKLTLNNAGKYPEGVDLMRINSEQETDFWGYQFSLIPNFKGRNPKLIESYLSFATDEDRINWRESYKPTYCKYFKDGTAQKFIEFMDDYLNSHSIGFDTMLSESSLSISEEELIYYPELQKLSEIELFNLKEILFNFCSRFQNYFYLFDLNAEVEPENSLMKFIKKAKYYLLINFKLDRLINHLDKSKTDCRVEIIIDKNKAQDIKAKGENDSSATATMFSQLSRAIGKASNKTLRHPEKLFKLRYKGELTSDDSNTYNELLIETSKELQSSALPLLIPSQNNLLNVGNGRDNWIVNPTSTLPVHMHLFKTLGKLFGSAIRTYVPLRLSLPIIIFKHLLYEEVSTDDLIDFDFPLYQFLHKLRNLEAYGITLENFSQHISKKFIVKYGEEVIELCEDGAKIDVTFENARHFADLLEKQKLFENPKAYQAIRKGMAAVIPIDILHLFTASQLRDLICMKQEVNFSILEENTNYENCKRSDFYIENFWAAIDSFNWNDRYKFIDYIARRSRLNEWNWPHKFTIAKYSKSEDVNVLLPIVDNINCRLEMPMCNSPEIMKEKIIKAIASAPKFDFLDINI